jgi:hypothetical protein
MIPQMGGKWRELFKGWGFNIDDAEFGRLMTPADHSQLHAVKVRGKTYNQHWEDFVNRGQPTRAQLDSFLKKIEGDFAGYLNKSRTTILSYKEWGDNTTAMKDAIFRAHRTGNACLVLKVAGKSIAVGTFIYNANSGGVVFAADQAAKDLVFYDELDPLLKYAAHSASTRIVALLTRRPDGNLDVYRCRCLQCRKTPDNCRCEGGPLRQ